MKPAKSMSHEIELVRKDRDTIGSVVELLIEGLPIGVGEPWFDGIEPSLARALMAIPGARAIEFSHGTRSSTMRGSEHNDCMGARSRRTYPRRIIRSSCRRLIGRALHRFSNLRQDPFQTT